MIFLVYQISANTTLVVLIWESLPRPAIRPFFHILIHFLLLLAIVTFNVIDNYDFQGCQLSANNIVGFIDVGVSSLPSNKNICSFFSTFSLIAGYWDHEFKWQYDLLVPHVSGNVIFDFFYVGVFSSPSNKTISSFFSIFPFIIEYWNFQCKW